MNVQVVGAGSWGLALARLLSLNGHGVRLHCRDTGQAEALRGSRRSPFYLTDMELPAAVEVANEIDPDSELAVLAVPSHAMRDVVAQHPFSLKTIRVSVAKGIENDSLLRMSEVIQSVSGGVNVVALSGPSHAEEVSRDLPVSLVAAGTDHEACRVVQDAFTAKSFRVYTSPDIIGVELGGALKNVIAIAAGVCDGYKLGDSAKAALITRGLAEISRLGIALGADPLTFAGLSGMGDLIVTCQSRHSRNRGLGEQLASGLTLEQATAGSHMVVEGVRNTRSACALAARATIELPIAQEVARILFDNANPRDAVDNLMLRTPKPERT